MPEPILLLVGLAAAAALVVPPLLRRNATVHDGQDERDAAVVRHRVALETLRDVEADRRAGSLDDAAYADQLAQAEGRAAATSAALTAVPSRSDPVLGQDGHGHRHGPRRAIAAAAVIGTALMLGALLPSTGLANPTVVNQGLADAQAAEADRQDRISELLVSLDSDAPDPGTLSDLADAYLAGDTEDDLVRAAVALRLLIELEPDRADAYERILGAYLRAGDPGNARAVHDTYAAVTSADPVELAFFDGLIAVAEGDTAAAVEAFDRFLELAPDDPRAGMVRGLRDEASGRP